MRNLAILTVAAFAVCAAGAAASAAEVAKPVADCIRANASAVEQAVPSLTEATNFLVDQVCAVEVTNETQHQQAMRLQELQDAQLRECEHREAANNNGKPPPNACAQYTAADNTFASFLTGPFNTFSSMRKLPEASAFAAKTLLDLRLSHSNSGHPH